MGYVSRDTSPIIVLRFERYFSHYGVTILAKIRKLEKTMIKYLSFINYLRFSLRCTHSKVVPKDLQLKSRIKTERVKIILQRAGKLLLQERIHINHVIQELMIK